jgi:UDP-glucose 4-epimerase
MDIFLTGGTGFIGSYVAKALLDAGHTLSVLVRNPQKTASLSGLPGVRIINGTLTDYELIAEHLGNKDAVIHVALGWGDTAADMLKNDTLPSVVLMQQAAEAGVKHFIYTSSTAALGWLFADADEETKTKPVDLYGATKAASENFLLAAAFRSAMRGNIIRPGYTFGNPVTEGAVTQPDRRFHDIVEKALSGRDIELTRHDGTQFIYAGDLAKIYMAVLASNVNRQIYLGLGQDYITWEEIAAQAIALTGSPSKIVLKDGGFSDRPLCYRLDKIAREFGFRFKARDKIRAHLEYLCGILSAQ